MRVKYNCGQTKLLFPIKRYHLLPVDEDESTSKAFTIPRRVLITWSDQGSLWISHLSGAVLVLLEDSPIAGLSPLSNC